MGNLDMASSSPLYLLLIFGFDPLGFIFILVLICLTLMHADLSIICGVQREIWNDKGCFLQVAQMETEQTQNGCSVILIVTCLLCLLSPPCSSGCR